MEEAYSVHLKGRVRRDPPGVLGQRISKKKTEKKERP